jgi:hypothetical protein
MLSSPLDVAWKGKRIEFKEITHPRPQTLPSVGMQSPPTILRRVDLPEPFGPIMATRSPAVTENVISFRAQEAVGLSCPSL